MNGTLNTPPYLLGQTCCHNLTSWLNDSQDPVWRPFIWIRSLLSARLTLSSAASWHHTSASSCLMLAWPFKLNWKQRLRRGEALNFEILHGTFALTVSLRGPASALPYSSLRNSSLRPSTFLGVNCMWHPHYSFGQWLSSFCWRASCFAPVLFFAKTALLIMQLF